MIFLSEFFCIKLLLWSHWVLGLKEENSEQIYKLELFKFSYIFVIKNTKN
jgi:hypothetical protein